MVTYIVDISWDNYHIGGFIQENPTAWDLNLTYGEWIGPHKELGEQGIFSLGNIVLGHKDMMKPWGTFLELSYKGSTITNAALVHGTEPVTGNFESGTIIGTVNHTPIEIPAVPEASSALFVVAFLLVLTLYKIKR